MRPFRPWLALVGLGTAPAPAAAQSGGTDPMTLTVFAAASLTDAFEDLGTLFQRGHHGVTVRFNFAGSQQLAAQLEHGASGDVFASADQRWMAQVKRLGLAAGQPEVFAHNRLVILLPAENPARIGRQEDLARPGLKLVLAADAVPAGRYSREVLRNLSRRPGFGSDFERRVLANVVSEEENVKGVVAKVQLAEADAGMVYRSDVTAGIAAKVRVLDIPIEANVVARYPIVVLSASKAPGAARAFVELVRGPEGRAALRRHGLTPPPVTP